MTPFTYRGLTGAINTVQVDTATATIADLIAAVAQSEGLPDDYYVISLTGIPGVNSTVLLHSTLLSTAGIDGSRRIQCTPLQNGLDKPARQRQRLDIAAVQRNSAYDISLLPTRYLNNTELTDNPNSQGLVQGRPWVGWNPSLWFIRARLGAWYQFGDLSTLYQDSAGTVPVVADGDPAGLMLDKSPNNTSAIQPISMSRLQYLENPSRVKMDAVDDNITIDFGEPFTGTVLQGTPNGVIHMEIDVPTGVWALTKLPQYVPGNGEITGLIAVEGAVENVGLAETYLRDNGAGVDFAGVTSMSQWFRGRSDITGIYSGAWDTSSVTNFGVFALGCSSLTTLDVSNWNTSSVTNFGAFAYNCSSLTTLDVSNWNTSSVTNFGAFALGCSSLTTVTVNGGTGNPFADSPCTNYINAFTNTNLTQQSIDDILVAIEQAGTSNGTFDQSGGSAPSIAGEAAIDALRARGWTIAVTGGY